MKKINILMASIAITSVFACGQANNQEENNQDTTDSIAQADAQSPDTMKTAGAYGKVIEVEGAKSMEEFNEMTTQSDTISVKLLSTVNEVCKKKGCWMKVELADGSLMRVTFKDYGFFVPEDIVNKKVVFEGIAYNDTIPVEDLKHFAEDAGRSEKDIAAITEPEIKTVFVAEGVREVQL